RDHGDAARHALSTKQELRFHPPWQRQLARVDRTALANGYPRGKNLAELLRCMSALLRIYHWRRGILGRPLSRANGGWRVWSQRPQLRAGQSGQRNADEAAGAAPHFFVEPARQL